MHIFIDESGTFVPPGQGQHSMCCVATLAVRDSSLERMVASHQQLLSDWNPPGGELKGRTLTDRKIDRAITLLGHLDVVLSIVAIDMGYVTDSIPASNGVETIGFGETPMMHPEFVLATGRPGCSLISVAGDARPDWPCHADT